MHPNDSVSHTIDILRGLAETLPAAECPEQEVERALPRLAQALRGKHIRLLESGAPESDEDPSATAPLYAGGHLWGRLAIYGAEGEWPAAQDDGLRAAAGIIGAAIHNREARDELRIARDRLRFVMSSSPAILFTTDPARDFAITSVSDNVEAAMGIPASMFLEGPHFWRDLIHPDDRNAVVAANRELSAEAASVTQFRYRHTSGEIRWMRREMRLVPASESRPAEIIGCLLDITETVQALESLRYREAILEAVSFLAESFLRDQEWEVAIPAALERLGKAASADEVLLIQRVAGAGTSTRIKLRQVWTADESGGASATFPAGANTPPVPGFSPWENTLDQGQLIAGRVSGMSAPERAMLDCMTSTSFSP